MKKIFLAILLVCGVSTGALAKKATFLSCGPYNFAIEENTTNIVVSNLQSNIKGTKRGAFFFIIDFVKNRGTPIGMKFFINRVSLEFEEVDTRDTTVKSRGTCILGRKF